MPLFAMIKQSKLILIMHKSILIREFLYNIKNLLIKQLILVKMKMQLFAMIKQFNLILIMHKPILIKVICYTFSQNSYKVIEMKKYQSAIENYEQALLYCKLYQNEFKQLIGELRIKK